MDRLDMEQLLKNLDRRTEQVERILPTLATKQELQATVQAAIAPLATKQELQATVQAAIAPLATKQELLATVEAAIAPLATKQELQAAVALLATKEELQAAIAPLATKVEMREEGERTRRHFDVIAESLRDDIRIIAEGHVALDARVTRLERLH